MWSIVWFRASFYSTPMIISCLSFMERFRLHPEPFYRELNKKNMGNRFWASKEGVHVASTGTHQVQCLLSVTGLQCCGWSISVMCVKLITVSWEIFNLFFLLYLTSD